MDKKDKNFSAVDSAYMIDGDGFVIPKISADKFDAFISALQNGHRATHDGTFCTLNMNGVYATIRKLENTDTVFIGIAGRPIWLRLTDIAEGFQEILDRC